MKTLSLDFVRQAIEQTLFEEHLKNGKYFGGKDQVNLMSFYEQLVEDYEVDRYTEVYRDLVDQQNRSGLIMNGTIVAPETPQIMNINSALIVPMTFNVSFRVKLKDRDSAIETIDNLMKIMRGRKRDIAMFENGKLFMVGTIANNVLGSPEIKDGDFIGTLANINENEINNNIDAQLTNIATYLGSDTIVSGTYHYFECEGKLYKAIKNDNEEWIVDENFTYHSTEFEKYKVSISFDSMKVDEPKTLNAEEYCTILFSGSATLVDAKVRLGNDLTKVAIAKHSLKLKAQTLTLDRVKHWLEPLEMPSGLGISSELSQLASHNFNQNKHNDGINPTFSYSFVLDTQEPLIAQLFKYSRYGILGTPQNTYSDGVTPNTLYEITELWNSWCVIEKYSFLAKATENIDNETTESDAMSIKLTFEKQKEE